MSRINGANLKKTYYYLKRNGLRDTYLAALERLQEKPVIQSDKPLAEADIQMQREKTWEYEPKFSILVPTFKTKEVYLREMVDSVLNQTYSNLELIIADASGDDSVSKVINEYEDSRIVFVSLQSNLGISGNTNAALTKATGDYIGLLDHDDVLTLDALFQVATLLETAHETGEKLHLIYSDEDKCDENTQNFYEIHRKTEFNLDLILSNNYICHFLVLSKEIMEGIFFRPEYDGAQDYDLVLQCVHKLMGLGAAEDFIAHIPRVLYHWRCHQQSTAVNPRSKMYAYEAGQKAVQNFLKELAWPGRVEALKHLGFYRVDYAEECFARPDLGAVGMPLWKNNKITGGIYTKEGICPYKGLKRGFSGYMHRASLQQNAYAVDVRKMKVREELLPLYEEVVGIAYGTPLSLGEDEYIEISLKLCEAIRQKGYRILWDPRGKA
ncbi:MAG: glycosyltransferase [Lachnospiraceae bacterium]|nr:glycosyltransferase [Lachnospiraceae bacterium]